MAIALCIQLWRLVFFHAHHCVHRKSTNVGSAQPTLRNVLELQNQHQQAMTIALYLERWTWAKGAMSKLLAAAAHAHVIGRVMEGIGCHR